MVNAMSQFFLNLNSLLGVLSIIKQSFLCLVEYSNISINLSSVIIPDTSGYICSNTLRELANLNKMNKSTLRRITGGIALIY